MCALAAPQSRRGQAWQSARIFNADTRVRCRAIVTTIVGRTPLRKHRRSENEGSLRIARACDKKEAPTVYTQFGKFTPSYTCMERAVEKNIYANVARNRLSGEHQNSVCSGTVNNDLFFLSTIFIARRRIFFLSIYPPRFSSRPLKHTVRVFVLRQAVYFATLQKKTSCISRVHSIISR